MVHRYIDRTAHVHFVGIGGIGMSGIAEVLCNLGFVVSGSDVKRSKNTDRLENELNIRISEGHARAILSLKGMSDKQAELLRSVLDNGWTVRQAEQFATAAKKGASADAAKSRTASETELTRGIGRKLGTRVQIKHTAKGGQLIIRFDSDEHLQQISQKLT